MHRAKVGRGCVAIDYSARLSFGGHQSACPGQQQDNHSRTTPKLSISSGM